MEGVGVFVAYLGKVIGFVSLFCRIEKGGRDSFLITPDELYQFSHKVPSYKMTGKEENSVPKGAFELDPAALPRNIEEISVPKDLDAFASEYIIKQMQEFGKVKTQKLMLQVGSWPVKMIRRLG